MLKVEAVCYFTAKPRDISFSGFCRNTLASQTDDRRDILRQVLYCIALHAKLCNAIGIATFS